MQLGRMEALNSVNVKNFLTNFLQQELRLTDGKNSNDRMEESNLLTLHLN